MTDLNNFGDSERWRLDLKKFLVMEREKYANKCERPALNRRLSFDTATQFGDNVDGKENKSPRETLSQNTNSESPKLASEFLHQKEILKENPNGETPCASFVGNRKAEGMFLSDLKESYCLDDPTEISETAEKKLVSDELNQKVKNDSLERSVSELWLESMNDGIEAYSTSQYINLSNMDTFRKTASQNPSDPTGIVKSEFSLHGAKKDQRSPMINQDGFPEEASSLRSISIKLSPGKSAQKKNDAKDKLRFLNMQDSPYQNIPDKFNVNINPIPKLNLFDSSPVRKRIMNNKFQHVVSPIGTYLKKCGEVPLMLNLKNVNHNIHLLTTMLEKNEKEFANTSCESIISLKKLKKLPKKSYVSAQYKQIKDHRTVINIPGGKAIHKIIEPALTPAVLRHDGKLNFKDLLNSGAGSNFSAEVSLCTVNDAHRF